MLEDAKLIGSTSYIYEVGCGVVIDGEKTVLVGDAKAERARPWRRRSSIQGSAGELFEHFAGHLEWHSAWHRQRRHSLLFRGKVDTDEANRLLAERATGRCD